MKTTLLLNLVLLGFLVNLNATVHTVTLSGDHAESPQEGMLRYYINHAAKGDTIVFDVDHITLVASLRISYKGLTLLGGEGVVLDGNHADRVLNVSYDSFNKVVLKNLTIQNGFLQDESMAMGGGMYAFGTGGNENLLVENCTFRNNEVACNGDGQGGALRTQGGTFINCSFLDNAVTGTGYSNSGGAVMSVGGTFINCLVAGNSAKFGGGLYATSGSKIINSTITQNTSGNGGNGAGLSLESASTCVNSILFDNFTGTIQDNLDVSDATLSFCAMEQGNAKVGTNNNIGLSASPFANSASGDFSLAENSSCIDAGKSDLTEITTHDLAGNKRIAGNAIDLGAYELYIPIVISGTLQLEDGTLLPNYNLHPLITTDPTGAYHVAVGEDGMEENEVLVLNAAPEGFEFYPKEIVLDGSKTIHITAYEGMVVDKDYTTGSTIEWESGTVNVFTTVTLNNSSLTIPRNTLVKFHGHYGIRVSGTGQLIAVGTHDQPITFTSANKEDFVSKSFSRLGSWNKIAFNEMSADADTSRLEFCVLQYSKETTNYNYGGALSVIKFDKLLVTSCLFQHNSAVPGGAGAIYIEDSNFNLVNSIITNNYCGLTNNGGGIYVSIFGLSKTVQIINCNITNNEAAGEGGGLAARAGYSYAPVVKVYNSIISGNKAGVRDEQVSGEFIDVYNSYVEGVSPSMFNQHNQVFTTGVVFAAPEGTIPQLAESSVCINSGTLETIAHFLPKVDILGQPRIHQASIDLGAVENQNNITSTITGILSNEVGLAIENFELYPGITTNEAGEFTIVAGENGLNNGDVLDLNIPENLFLYPRKIVVGDNQIREINVTAYQDMVVDEYTVFDKITNWNGLVHVMVHIALDDIELHLAPGTTVKFHNHSHIDVSEKGRIVAKGALNDTITFTSGKTAGHNLYNKNTSTAWGGIRYSNMSQSADKSVFDYCKIEYVKNIWEGGAMQIEKFNKIEFNNCLFQKNSGFNGGAFHVKESSLTISNTIIKDNGTLAIGSYGSHKGGAGLYTNWSDLKIIGCVISNNIAFGHGGGILAFASELTIVNSHIINNEFGLPTVELKSIENSGSTLNIYNSILWGNTTRDLEEQITSNSFSPVAINLYNSCVQNGNTFSANVYQNCTEADPMFMNEAIGDYRLQSGSPLINAGMDNIPNNWLPEFDLLNNLRRMGNSVDIGAYEHSEATLIIKAPKQHPVNESFDVEGEVYLGSGTSWSWDFNADGIEDVNTPTASYTFNEKGTYTIRLSAHITERSATDDVYHTIRIMEEPVAGFSVENTQIVVNGAVVFTDESLNEPTQWLWDFGDGNTSTEQNPSHFYEATGLYTVSLTVSNVAGTDRETKTDYITIYSLPVVDFAASEIVGKAPLTVSFTNLTLHNPTKFTWSFGDGWNINEKNPTHTYQTPGVYSVRLNATNQYGSSSLLKVDYIRVLDPVTSLNPTPKGGFRVYPNPVSSTLSIEADKLYNIRLTDLTGKLVFQTQMVGLQQSIHTGEWPNGVYFVQLYKDGEVFTQKIVKR